MLATARHLSLKGGMNSVYKIPSYFFKIHLMSPSLLRLDFPSGILTSGFATKIVTWKQHQKINMYILVISGFYRAFLKSITFIGRLIRGLEL